MHERTGKGSTVLATVSIAHVRKSGNSEAVSFLYTVRYSSA